MRKLLPYLAIFMSMLFWGSSFVLTKYLLDSFPPISLIFFRLFLSSVIFVIMGLFVYKKKFFIPKSVWGLFVVLSLFEPVIYFIFETYSLKWSDPSVVSVIISTIPLFIAVVAYYFLKEKLTRINFIGAAISVMGILIMLFPSLMSANMNLLGILFAFGAVLSAVGYNYVLQKIPSEYPPLLVITWQNLIALIIFTPLLFLTNSSQALSAQFQNLFVPSNLIPLLLLAVFCSSFAFMFYLYALRLIGTARTSIFSNLIPAVTAVLSFAWLSEQITWNKVLGILVVLLGITLVQMKNEARKASPVA